MQKLSDIMENLMQIEGHTSIDLTKVERYAGKTLVNEGFERKVIVKRDGGKCALDVVDKMETSIAENIVHQVHLKNLDVSDELIDRLIDRFEEESEANMGFKCKLHEEQRNAVHMAVKEHFCIITGGPGTGKTTVLNAVRFVLNNVSPNANVGYAAPTGKAARRITESVGVQARTVQKMIGANEYGENPYKLAHTIVFIDEISMLDTVTTYNLMRSIQDYTKVVMLGDVDQLPSVGFGSVLRDLIDSRVVPVTKLEKTFRQKDGSTLADNILAIKKGFNGLLEGEDFKRKKVAEDENIADALIEKYLERREVCGPDGVVLLTPYRRKGNTCANIMNKRLQKHLNPNAKGIHVFVQDTEEDGTPYEIEVDLRIGDPVMQLVNRNDSPIANGDVGKVVKINSDDSVIVDFGFTKKLYKVEELKELNLAYAMSIHKSQGSEYACVITCILPEHERLLSRNLVYTAITRAKKECVFYYNPETLDRALEIEGAYLRDTGLCEKIETQEKLWQLLDKAQRCA